MKIENSFEVAAPKRSAWELLMDVPRVVPCMPGAELTETVDDANWKAKVSVKLGPIALQFAADIARTEVDEANDRVVLSTKARETRGRGGAQAAIESRLTELGPAHTRVEVVTDLSLSGAVAQYGRGIVQDVAGQMVAKFAECLQAQLAGSAEEAHAAVEEASRPVSGLSLGLGAILRSIGRLIRGLFGGGR
jgi:hypothetical protein